MHAKRPRAARAGLAYRGVGIAQNPPMHDTPVDPAPQQSAVVAHFSPTFAQPVGGGMQANPPPPSGASRQKPPQQSLPAWHELPFASHGGSVQKARMFPPPSSCPGR